MNEPTVFNRDIQVIPSKLGRDSEGNVILSFTTVLCCKIRNVAEKDRIEWMLENGNLFLFINGKLVESEEMLASFGDYNLVLDGKGQVLMRAK